MESLTIQDIFIIFQRRRKIFFTAFAIVLVLGLGFAWRWSTYRSSATVQVEQSYVSSAVTTAAGMNPADTMIALADQRISHIEQRVTGLESLAEIINKFNLYPGERDSVPISTITAKMRKKIKMQLVSSTISNPAAAMKETAEQLSAIAFTLSFDYSNPALSQQVVGELVTRFLDEDLKQRRTQAQETSAFLAAQISQLETSMADQEKAIAEFRAAHGESGETALMFNQQANVTTTMTLQSVESQLTSNEGNQGNLRAQLAVTEPYSRVISDGQVLTTPAVQLKALQAQYASMSAQYGPDHPDLVKLRRQIGSLKSQVTDTSGGEQLNAQIADVKTNIAAAEKTYGSDHPDVQALKRQLAGLEERRAKGGDGQAADLIKKDADNPAYLQIVAQLHSAEEQHKSLEEQRDALRAQKTKYEKSITENPGLEQQFLKLNRDYDNSQLRYRELKSKKMSADMMEQLEQGRKGQRLVVTVPPSVPDTTYPARSYIVIGAFLFALVTGLGSVTVVEMSSQSVRSAEHLSSLVGAMPLISIPYLYTNEEAQHPLRRLGSRKYITEKAVQFSTIAIKLAFKGIKEARKYSKMAIEHAIRIKNEKMKK